VSPAAARLTGVSDTEKPTLLVIDGHSLAFRAFYALPVDSFVNREGQHTNAIHGFLSMLILLLQNEKPTHLAVAFDISRYSFRTREYPEYKGTRGETPPEFTGQVPLLEEALKAMGVTTLSKEDYEADDILATLATRGAADGFRVLVVSGDRDAIQMVKPDVTLLYPNARGVSELKRYDRDAVMERYGIEPEQYPDVAALVGETSDNLIGIDKVGEKTAVKWITQYGSLDGILEHADEITGVVGEKLREQKDRAIRNRKLNHLVTDVDLPVGPADLARRPIDETAVREVFDRLQFKTLLERVLKIAAAERGDDGSGAVAAAPPANVIPVVRTMVDEELAKWIATVSANGTAPLGLRIQTVNGEVTGFGLASATESAYVPWAPGRPDYVALEDWLASDAPKYLQGAKSQLKAATAAGLGLAGIAFDTTLGAWLIKPAPSPRPSSRRSTSTSASGSSSPTRTSSCPRRRPRVLRPRRGTSCGSPSTSPRNLSPAPAACSTTSSCRSCPCSPAWRRRGSPSIAGSSAELTTDLGATAERGRAEGLRRDRPRDQPRQPQAAAGGALRPARHAQDPLQQDRVLDGCREPRRPAGAESRIRSSTCCCSTGMPPSSCRSSRASTRRWMLAAACTRPTSRRAPAPGASPRTTPTCRTYR
jgi:5'-3' exonuclease